MRTPVLPILEKILRDEALTEPEQKLLNDWKMLSPDNEMLVSHIQSGSWLAEELHFFIVNEARIPEIKQLFVHSGQAFVTNNTVNNKPAEFFKKAVWRWVAAAILVLAIGSGIYYLNNPHSKSGESGKSGFKTMVQDVAPGTNRAILTINNKQNIALETNKTGININNTITYNDGEKIADAGQLLQLTTPRGGQYQAVLPDGSKVWLNAASSIKFPSKFTDKERRVEITGEAYFEIAKNNRLPFIVTTDKTSIQVLGTSFNINTYPDEVTQKTTLITGSVKVSSSNQQILLSPGEQAAYNNASGTLITNPSANIAQVIAWKNGYFNFDGMQLTEIIRQLEKWYDIEVHIENKKNNNEKFRGELPRNLNLSQIIETLKDLGIQCRIEDKTLIVY